MRATLVYTTLGVLVTVAALAFWTGEDPSAERQKPTKSRTMHTDGGVGAPDTTDELWAMSPLVVDALIKNSRPADTTLTGAVRFLLETGTR
ncbi:MAG TPA: hypothetical protein VNJ03_01380 [Vicinamibacterales bacterium]|nr:hypothetical protein [Vicinamibacterales bacterium]